MAGAALHGLCDAGRRDRRLFSGSALIFVGFSKPFEYSLHLFQKQIYFLVIIILNNIPRGTDNQNKDINDILH